MANGSVSHILKSKLTLLITIVKNEDFCNIILCFFEVARYLEVDKFRHGTPENVQSVKHHLHFVIFV
jgi:hypothetical protein